MTDCKSSRERSSPETEYTKLTKQRTLVLLQMAELSLYEFLCVLDGLDPRPIGNDARPLANQDWRDYFQRLGLWRAHPSVFTMWAFCANRSALPIVDAHGILERAAEECFVHYYKEYSTDHWVRFGDRMAGNFNETFYKIGEAICRENGEPIADDIDGEAGSINSEQVVTSNPAPPQPWDEITDAEVEAYRGASRLETKKQHAYWTRLYIPLEESNICTNQKAYGRNVWLKLGKPKTPKGDCIALAVAKFRKDLPDFR